MSYGVIAIRGYINAITRLHGYFPLISYEDALAFENVHFMLVIMVVERGSIGTGLGFNDSHIEIFSAILMRDNPSHGSAFPQPITFHVLIVLYLYFHSHSSPDEMQ
jgi:hypothetical protein